MQQTDGKYDYAPVILVVQLFASVINASILASGGLSLCPGEDSSFISIRPWTFAIDISRELRDQPVAEDILSFNFGYCVVAQNNKNEDMVFRFLLNSADATVWIGLLGAIILVGYTVPIALGIDGGLRRPAASAMMATLAVLLTPGSSPQPKMAQHSVFFVVWMYASIIFVTYYPGYLTSKIIRPPTEAQMTSIEEIFGRNYTLLFGRFSRRMIGGLTRSVLQGSRKNNETCRTAMVDSAEMLEELFNKSIVPDSSISLSEKFSAAEISVTVSTWPAVIWNINVVKMDMEDKGIKGRIKCYIGQQLAYPTQMYYVISPALSQGGAKMVKNSER